MEYFKTGQMDRVVRSRKQAMVQFVQFINLSKKNARPPNYLSQSLEMQYCVILWRITRFFLNFNILKKFQGHLPVLL